jgi:hypothetical protein
VEIANEGRRSLIKAPVSLIDAGARSLAASDGGRLRSRGADVLVCEEALGASPAECRRMIEQGRAY